MNASLHSIVSSKIHNIYVIKYKLANGDEYYAQMRLHRLQNSDDFSTTLN